MLYTVYSIFVSNTNKVYLTVAKMSTNNQWRLVVQFLKSAATAATAEEKLTKIYNAIKRILLKLTLYED